MGRVRLLFKNVSEIVGTKNIGLLIMVDEFQQNQLTIPCDKGILYQFEMRINCAPVVSKLLPEALWSIISLQTDLHFELVIDHIVDGQYRAILYNRETLQPVAIRASDAVLLAYIAKIPIYASSDLMRKQSVPYNGGSRDIPLPVNTIDDAMLQQALDKAIKDENYELASNLRDEMLRRKRKDEQQQADEDNISV